MQNLNTILAYAYANLTKTDILNEIEIFDSETDENCFVSNEMRALTLCSNCSGKKSRRKDKVTHYSFHCFTTVLLNKIDAFCAQTNDLIWLIFTWIFDKNFVKTLSCCGSNWFGNYISTQAKIIPGSIEILTPNPLFYAYLRNAFLNYFSFVLDKSI